MIDRTLLTPMTAADLYAALAQGVTTFTNVDLSGQALELPSSTMSGLVFQNCSFDDASAPSGSGFSGCS